MRRREKKKKIMEAILNYHYSESQPSEINVGIETENGHEKQSQFHFKFSYENFANCLVVKETKCRPF